MITLIFVQHDGSEQTVEAEVGSTVKDAAVDNGVEGIAAECGGQSVCGTCHAYVDERHIQNLSDATELEQELLEGSMECKPNSRLTCQLTVDERMNGMVLTVPESLY